MIDIITHNDRMKRHRQWDFRGVIDIGFWDECKTAYLFLVLGDYVVILLTRLWILSRDDRLYIGFYHDYMD